MKGIGNILLRTRRVLYSAWAKVGNKLNYRTLFSFKSTKYIFGKERFQDASSR